MALLASANVEVGTLGEFFASAGTVAASQVQAHTGTWSVRANPVAATGTVSLRPPSGDMGRTAQTIYVVWFRLAAFPASGVAIAAAEDSTGIIAADMEVNATGQIVGAGFDTSAVAATVSLNTWYCGILSVISNGASSVRIDGLGTTQSFTADNVTQDRLVLGVLQARTMDMFIDDISIYDSAWTAGTTSPHFATPVAAPVIARSVSFGREAGRWIR